MPTVQLSDGRTAVFPDGMNMDDMAAALKKLPPPPQQAIAGQASANLAKIQSGGDIPPGVNLQNPSVSQEFLNTPSGRAMQIPADFTTGVAQGAASTVYGLGKLAHHLPGMNTVAPDTAGAFSGAPPAALQPTTTAGKVGKAAEQIGEFMIPGQAEAGVLAPGARMLAKAGMLGDIASGAAVGGGVTAAQGGNPAIGAAAGGAAPIVQGMAEAVAPRILNSAIGAAKSALKTGANPGQGMVDAGIVSPTWSKALDQVSQANDAIGKRIGNVLDRISQGNAFSLDLTDAVQGPIDNGASGLNTLGKKAAASSLDDMKQGIVDRIEKTGGKLDNLTPKQAFEVVKEINKGIRNWSTDDAMTSTIGIAKEIRRNIVNEISDAYKPIKSLNSQYANLSEAGDAIQDRLINIARTSPLSRLESLRSMGVLAGSYLFHHPVVGVGAVATDAALHTPLGATAGAQFLRGVAAVPPEVAPALASQATQERQ